MLILVIINRMLNELYDLEKFLLDEESMFRVLEEVVEIRIISGDFENASMMRVGILEFGEIHMDPFPRGWSRPRKQ